MLEIVFQIIQNIIFVIFLKKFLLKIIIIHFIVDIITVLRMKSYILKIEIRNLKWITTK